MKKTIAVLATVLLLGGCKDAFTPEGISGTYTLRSVNGISVPAEVTLTDGGQSFTVTFVSATVNINANGTYALSLVQEFTAGGTTLSETFTESGTYVLTGTATVTLTDNEGGDPTSGTLAGSTFTIISEGATFIFRK